MATKDFTFSFQSSQSPEHIFDTLLNVNEWWTGLYSEHITGKSAKPGDEFTFSAGGGVHNSKQKLIELVPDRKIVWQVTDSNLTFLKKADEWTDTCISFEISGEGKHHTVTFTHLGLVPKIECYGECAGAWTKYLENLSVKLK
jgi:hypothetical protein